MNVQALNQILQRKNQGFTNIQLARNNVKYTTFKVADGITQGKLQKSLENFQFQDGHRYWISAFYRFGRRGGQFFDGNSFSADALYNIAREYKNANNANDELIRYLTIYSVPLPPNRGGLDRHNDCFYNSLVAILGDNKKLPKIINTAKKLKDFLKLERDDMISYEHIEILEKEVFPENTSISVRSTNPYSSKKVHATLNFNLKLSDEHYSPLCNEGKSKQNVNTKLYEFDLERTPTQLCAVLVDGLKIHVYNGEYKELPYAEINLLFKDNIILTKSLETNEKIRDLKELKSCYEFYMKLGNSMKRDTNNKINVFKFKSMHYCILNALRFFSKNVTLPEPMDTVEQFWCYMAYAGGHIYGEKYEVMIKIPIIHIFYGVNVRSP